MSFFLRLRTYTLQRVSNVCIAPFFRNGKKRKGTKGHLYLINLCYGFFYALINERNEHISRCPKTYAYITFITIVKVIFYKSHLDCCKSTWHKKTTRRSTSKCRIPFIQIINFWILGALHIRQVFTILTYDRN